MAEVKFVDLSAGQPDPWDTVTKALSVAGTIYGIKDAISKRDALITEQKQKQETAVLDKQKTGLEISKLGEEVAGQERRKKGIYLVPEAHKQFDLVQPEINQKTGKMALPQGAQKILIEQDGQVSEAYGLPKTFDELGREVKRASLTKNLQDIEAGKNTPTNKLRSDWESNPVTKATDLVSQAYEKIAKAGSQGTPQSDMSLIFGYMKLQDPNSTVREGEYATAEKTRGWSDEARAAYNKALNGTKLSPDQRAGFIKSAGDIYKAQLGKQKEVDDFYSNIANTQNIKSDLVIRKFKMPEQLSESPFGASFSKDALDEAIRKKEQENIKSKGIGATIGK